MTGLNLRKADVAYVGRLKTFYRLTKGKYVPNNAKLLYYELLHLTYEADFANIQLDLSQLMSLIGTNSKNTVIKARKFLCDAGLVSFESGVKGNPTTYYL